jgi:hypothetical protein
MLHPELLNEDIYYYRTLTNPLFKLLEKGGELKWLVNYVKANNDFDFLTGSNKGASWISLYRGLSRFISVRNGLSSDKINVTGAAAYTKLSPGLYNKQNNPMDFLNELEILKRKVVGHPEKKFERHFDNKKEGYYQTKFSRKYGIEASATSEFLVIDKEAVIGYQSQKIKEEYEYDIIGHYRKFHRRLSKDNSARFGKNLGNKSLGTELDFLAIDKDGDILLIEFKHYSGKAYLAPIQLAVYYELFKKYQHDKKRNLLLAVQDNLEQKVELGLLPNWRVNNWNQRLKPWIVISQFDIERGTAFSKMKEIIHEYGIKQKLLSTDFLRELKIFTFNRTEKGENEFVLTDITKHIEIQNS